MAAENLDRDDDPFPRLEHERLAALVRGDIGRATELHADDYELVPPGGGVVDRAGYLEPIASGAFRYLRFEPTSPIRVRRLGEAIALRYQAWIEAAGDDWRDSGTFWHTDLWERRDGRWQAVWSQATRLPPSRDEA